MVKHTPGPWQVCNQSPVRPYYVAQVGHRVAAYSMVSSGTPTGGSGWPTIGPCGRSIDEIKANALLIAAAPDLLICLQQIQTELHKLSDRCGNIHLQTAIESSIVVNNIAIQKVLGV